MATSVVTMDSTDEPSTENDTFHYKIEEKTEKVIRPHQAETGMELSRDLMTEAGQLLFRKGKELDSEMIQKIKRFDVRRIHVTDTQTRWVDEANYHSVRDRATVVEKKTVPPSNGDSSEEQAETDEETFHDLFDLIRSLQTPDQLRTILDTFDQSVSRDTLENNLPDNHVERTINQNDKHKEALNRVLQQLDELDDPTDRASLLRYLFDERERGELDILDELPEELWDSVTRALDHKQETKSGLQEMLHECSALNQQMERDQLPSFDQSFDTDGSMGIDPSTGDQVELGELIDQLFRMLSGADEENMDHSEILEMIEGIGLSPRTGDGEDSNGTDSTVDDLGRDQLKSIEEALKGRREESPDDGLQYFKRALQQFGDGNWYDAIEQFSRSLEESPSIDAHEIEELVERSRAKKDRQSELEGRLGSELDDDASEIIERLLDPSRTGVLEDLHEKGISQPLIDDLVQLQENTKSLAISVSEEMSGQLPNLLDGVNDEVRRSIVDRFQAMTDRLKDNWLDISGKWDLYQRNTSEHGTVAKRTEQLRDALDRDDIGDLKQYTRLPEEVIDQYRECYRRPLETNKWQKKLIDSMEGILDDLVLTMRVPEDQLERLVKQITDVLNNESKPFSLLCDPPDPQQYHLVHAYNTCLLSVMIGRERDLPEEAIKTLVPAALLADIGLTIIPPSLYLKNHDLSRRGDNEITKHPIYSREIVGHIFGKDHSVTRIVAEHHEHANGKGYPKGLEGDELHPLSPLLTVADVYTARSEERLYRGGQMPDQILREMRNAPERFNGSAVDAIVRRIGIYPSGSVAKLSNEQIAYVHSQNPEDPLNPDVILLTDTRRNKLDSPTKCSLSTEDSLEIELLVKV